MVRPHSPLISPSPASAASFTDSGINAAQAVSGASIQLPPAGGADLCSDPRYKDGGAPIPAYNYAGVYFWTFMKLMLDLHLCGKHACCNRESM